MPENADDIDERELIARAVAGDAAAQERLYRAHAMAVYTLAMRVLRQPQAADEAVQETFVKVLTRLDKFRGEAAFGTWVRRVAMNECLQVLRSPWRRRSEPWQETAGPANLSTRMSVDPATDMSNEQIDLDRALGRLGATTRAVVWLHDVEGFTHQEIATSMGRTVSFSKSRLARGHKKLREHLNQQPDKTSCVTVLNNT